MTLLSDSERQDLEKQLCDLAEKWFGVSQVYNEGESIKAQYHVILEKLYQAGLRDLDIECELYDWHMPDYYLQYHYDTTPIEVLVQQLYDNRLMTTGRELRLFNTANVRLANMSPSANVWSQLFNGFDDACQDDEVMYGLIHLVESYMDTGYVQVLVNSTPQMYPHAQEWLERLYIRILNHEPSSLELKSIFHQISLSSQNIILKVFDLLIEEDKERFEPKIKFVLSTQ